MFTLRQIGIGGFFGVFSGCLPLSVNLARLPYWRGAIIGVFFGTLTQMLSMIIYVSVMLVAMSIMNDPIFHKTESLIFVIINYVAIQSLCSLGCQVMGKYFMAPRRKDQPFERKKLYEKLKAKDTGKRSVLHDVVRKLETEPAPPDVRFSTGWILFTGALSLIFDHIWFFIIRQACLEALFYGITMDAAWYLQIVGKCLIPWVFLVIIHAGILLWLCRDIKKISRAYGPQAHSPARRPRMPKA